MANMHRSSFRSSCDILEIEEEELNPLEHHNQPKSDGRSLASNAGRMSCLEDDLNQLFEIFNRRSSSQRMQNAAGPSRKKSSKKPVKASGSPGASGRGSLKEAFGGLCISQMASVKRSGGYKNVAVGDSTSMASQYQGKDSLLEASSTVQADFDCPSPLVENSQDEMHYYSLSASPVPDEDLLKTAKSSPIETPMFSASRSSVETVKHVATRNETVPGSPKMEMFQKQDHADATSSHWSDRVSITRQPMQICPTPCKPVNEGSAAKSSKPEDKNGLQTVPSSGLPNGKRLKKPMKSVSRLVKPVIKTKNFVKRKSRKDTRSEFNNALYPGSNHIVCPRCQCVLNDGWEEVEQDSPLSPAMSPSTELSPLSAVLSPCAGSPDNVFSDISTPTFNLNNTDKSKEAVKARRDNLKSGERGEITQSSISGPDECSSSTSISQENNLGRPSSWDRPHMSKDARWQAIQQHASVGLRNFNLLKKLGCGDIGTVYLAELIDTSCLFAIKVMDNEFLARRKKMTRAQTEREILRMLDHPFLPTLFCQFTSDNLSCLVMEYCPGGDLHVLRQMQPGRCFTEQAARFYVAEVLLALEYLHMLGVIYRDLKPENILVREDGHIMLSDFDLSLRCAVHPMLLVSPSTSGPYKDSSIRQPSCQVSCFGPKIPRRKPKPEQSDLLKPLLQLVAEPTDARSNSFVGTHEYLAPEIIKGEGHGSAVDWWTLGIFLFELLYGRTPFRGSGNEETLANVVLQGLDFPDSPLVSLHARDLIVGLLAKDPDGRLGSERGAAEIKQHPFFQGLNWALIRCAVPPDLPEFHRSNGVGKGSFNEKATNSNNSKYLEYNSSTGEHLEFEVF